MEQKDWAPSKEDAGKRKGRGAKGEEEGKGEEAKGKEEIKWAGGKR